MFEYRATLTSIVDGDTLKVVIDLGLRTYREETLRLYGVNTEEMHDPDPGRRDKAKAAKAFLASKLPTTINALRIVTYKPGSGMPKDQQDKYGRWLAEVWVGDAETSVNAQLLGLGLAASYLGGAR